MNKHKLCPECRFFIDPCLCAKAVSLENSIDLLLIMNTSEYFKSSNSGKLLSLAFANTKLILRGVKDNPINYEELAQGYDDVLCLFPHAKAQELSRDSSQEFSNNFAKRLLIVPDGNWPQGAKIANRIQDACPTARFLNLKVEKSVDGNPENFVEKKYVRYNPDKSRVSTFEAASKALMILEKRLDWQTQISPLYASFIDRSLKLRGLPTSSPITP